MSDDLELEMLRKRRLRELQKKHVLEQEKTEKIEQEQAEKQLTPEEILDKAFEGRAWEVWHAFEQQYPTIARGLKDVLAQLISEQKIEVTKISGEQLMYLFRKMGLRIRLQTKIRIAKRGEVKTLEDKLKEGFF